MEIANFWSLERGWFPSLVRRLGFKLVCSFAAGFELSTFVLFVDFLPSSYFVLFVGLRLGDGLFLQSRFSSQGLIPFLN